MSIGRQTLSRIVRSRETPLVGLLIVVIVGNALLQRNFFQIHIIRNNINSLAPFVLLTMAQAIIIIAGGLDLSLGTAASLANCVLATIMVQGAPETGIYALVFALIVCVAMGFINGYLIGVLRLNCVVITFCTSFVWLGVALAFRPLPGGYVHSWFRGFYNMARVENAPPILLAIGNFIPPVVLLIVFGIVLWGVISKTKLGRYIYATGGNEEGAYATGLRPGLVIIAANVIAYLFVFLAAVFITAQNMSGDAYVAREMTLITVAGAVLGTAMIGGGTGKVWLTIIAAIILQMVIKLMLFAGIPSVYHTVIQGFMIVAVTAAMIRMRMRKSSVSSKEVLE